MNLPRGTDAWRYRGFTLVELLLTIIIVSVLAAVAVPRFISLGSTARVASLKTLAGAIKSTAANVRVMCKTNPACDYNNQAQYLLIGGQWASLNYGWLDSGDNLGANEIDAWINYSGFPASLPSSAYTLFSLDGAPNPANCSVRYGDVYGYSPVATPTVTVTTTGC